MQLRPIRLGIGASHSGLDPPNQWSMKTIPHGCDHRPVWSRQPLSWDSFGSLEAPSSWQLKLTRTITVFNTGTKYSINVSLNKERRVEFGCSRWIKSIMAGKAQQQEHAGHTSSVVIKTERETWAPCSLFPNPHYGWDSFGVSAKLPWQCRHSWAQRLVFQQLLYPSQVDKMSHHGQREWRKARWMNL